MFDNFEHVLEAAPEVAELLSNCPDLRVLATSRAPLRVRYEHEYPISPLAMPDQDRTPEANEVSRAPAARLFVERAGEASPGFSLTPTNAAAEALLEEAAVPLYAWTDREMQQKATDAVAAPTRRVPASRGAWVCRLRP